jgi:hypothetical protein
MNRTDWDDDDWDEEPDEADGPDCVELIPCPHCGTDVYEEAERCPECGEYIVADTHPFAGRPWWWVALGVLGILAAVLALSSLLP